MQRQPITAADAATMDFSQLTGGCTLCRVGGGCGISYKATNPFRELWHNPFWSFASVSLPCPLYHIWEMEFNVLQIEFIARANDPCDKFDFRHPKKCPFLAYFDIRSHSEK